MKRSKRSEKIRRSLKLFDSSAFFNVLNFIEVEKVIEYQIISKKFYNKVIP